MQRRVRLSLVLRLSGAVALVLGSEAIPLLGRTSAMAAAPLPTGSSGGANLVFADNFDGTVLNAGTWHTCSWWATTTCSIETNNELELTPPTTCRWPTAC